MVHELLQHVRTEGEEKVEGKERKEMREGKKNEGKEVKKAEKNYLLVNFNEVYVIKEKKCDNRKIYIKT